MDFREGVPTLDWGRGVPTLDWGEGGTYLGCGRWGTYLGLKCGKGYLPWIGRGVHTLEGGVPTLAGPTLGGGWDSTYLGWVGGSTLTGYAAGGTPLATFFYHNSSIFRFLNYKV